MELQDLVRQYERNGYFDELIAVLEAGLGLERAHMGMFTELGIALSKYHPIILGMLMRDQKSLRCSITRSGWYLERAMPNSVNMPKMIRACEDASLWPELVFLYCYYDK
ncbi:uncharacterized protein AKAW2_11916A [Aspergillus luchuensis]|uniref:Uncharacterized protein n=1 Tax=Aspergillus kawachii TaxID=1069201 RepID=A0A7R7W1Z7_ASPKA|nr:uncharacterized protein AKAW2_11916A [Aspergillus luchuensis]BCR94870.1 hypothetical protein AKAW2_11916A [Aspergillus luchuensis]BCS07446.1 hypothetical protein ALUC_11827A [Aspergillus luchuensis]GAA86112.1 hypothetical protein AKAW_04226 [Aspergillus luchuensis IFO 4308]